MKYSLICFFFFLLFSCQADQSGKSKQQNANKSKVEKTNKNQKKSNNIKDKKRQAEKKSIKKEGNANNYWVRLQKEIACSDVQLGKLKRIKRDFKNKQNRLKKEDKDYKAAVQKLVGDKNKLMKKVLGEIGFQKKLKFDSENAAKNKK